MLPVLWLLYAAGQAYLSPKPLERVAFSLADKRYVEADLLVNPGVSGSVWYVGQRDGQIRAIRTDQTATIRIFREKDATTKYTDMRLIDLLRD